MRHPDPEDFINLIENKADTVELAATSEHLTTCHECQSTFEEFNGLLGILGGDAQYEPPSELLKWGVGLFQPVIQPVESKAAKVLRIAKLVFDSFEQPAMAGVRSGGSVPRQLLFRAGDVDVDVRIESSDDRVSLSGQILSESDIFSEHTPVWLESHGLVRYQTRTNPVGEFSFEEVPKDTYHLSLELPDGYLTLFCVHRQNPAQP
jgi:hypothetical protein